MSMIAKCPHCGFEDSVPSEYEGRKLKCPKCGETFSIDRKSSFEVVDDLQNESSSDDSTSRSSDKENVRGSRKEDGVDERIIGEIGGLMVTNKRIYGEICKMERQGNCVIRRQAHIDVLLNLLTGVTVVRSTNPTRYALFFPSAVLIVIGIFLIGAVEQLGAGCISILVALGVITAAMCIQDRIDLVLSIAGVDHCIAFKPEDEEEANQKCKLLKQAKSDYEHLAGL